MRFIFKTIILILLNSCGTAQRDGYQLAFEFHANYANEFIQNTELLKYTYNPRAHFYFNPYGEGSTFRALVHDTTQLRVIIFQNQDRFIQEFGLELDTHLTFGEAKIWNENGELKLQANDSQTLEIFSYDRNPLEHLKQLKKIINKYGIVTYGEVHIGGIIEVFLTAQDYLLYFPTNYKIEEMQFEKHWLNKQKLGKKLDENWFYYKADEPLDFG